MNIRTLLSIAALSGLLVTQVQAMTQAPVPVTPHVDNPTLWTRTKNFADTHGKLILGTIATVIAVLVITNEYQDFKKEHKAALSEMRDAISEVKTSITTTCRNIDTNIPEIKASVVNTCTKIDTNLPEIKNSVVNTCANIDQNLPEIKTSVTNTCTNIDTNIPKIEQSIAEVSDSVIDVCTDAKQSIHAGRNILQWLKQGFLAPFNKCKRIEHEAHADEHEEFFDAREIHII